MPPHVTRIYTAGGRLANISFQRRHRDPVDRREHHKVTVSHPNQSVVKIGVNTYVRAAMIKSSEYQCTKSNCMKKKNSKMFTKWL